ncbi:MAG: hypothetical protein J5809_07390 [Selenomonadaceae bacterium]|nr:hypothetical protein [Selenomonadaceae bacterium]
MRKIIFAVVFFIVSFIQNLASAVAPNQIDWSAAPKVNSKAELINYVRNCQRNFQPDIPVILANGLKVDSEKLFTDSELNKDLLAYRMKCTIYSDGSPNSRALYQFNYYPGAKVAYAYLNSNTKILSANEKTLYNLAVKIVNEAKAQPTTLRMELYIHDAITSRATYYNDTQKMLNGKSVPRFVTATGALIDKRANCQGYSDAFYMLGRMCGFEVRKVNGTTHNEGSNSKSEGHMWNTIKLGGKTYFVDVTWDDDSFKFSKRLGYNSYIYFNAPAEIASATHAWDKNSFRNLQVEPDACYYFTTPEFAATNGDYFGFYVRNTATALDSVAKRIAVEGRKMSWVMTPYEENFSADNALKKLAREILPKNYNYRSGTYNMGFARRGKYQLLFFNVNSVRR